MYQALNLVAKALRPMILRSAIAAQFCLILVMPVMYTYKILLHDDVQTL